MGWDWCRGLQGLTIHWANGDKTHAAISVWGWPGEIDEGKHPDVQRGQTIEKERQTLQR